MTTTSNYPPAENIWVILACFNEKYNLEELIPLILKHPVCVLVVDDSSPDGSAEYIRSHPDYNQRLFLHSRPAKLGYGSAVLEGFKQVQARGAGIAITIDADFSHDPAYIPEFIRSAHTHDLVIGSRYKDGIRILNWTISRLLLSLTANLYVKNILSLKYSDNTSGYRAYNARSIDTILQSPPSSNGYSFLVECLYLLHRRHFAITEIPIVFTERRAGQSKMSGHVIYEAMYRPLLLKLRTLFKRNM